MSQKILIQKVWGEVPKLAFLTNFSSDANEGP